MKATYLATTLAVVLMGSPAWLSAETVTFAEYDGMSNNDPIPEDSLPSGLPDGITATWTGFLLHTRAGDTPMSIFPAADVADGDDAAVGFSSPVTIDSINLFDTTWGSSFHVIGRLGDSEVWRFDSNDEVEMSWLKVTDGAGNAIDTLAFEGKWNHIDDIVVNVVPEPSTLGLSVLGFGLLLVRRLSR